MKYKIYIVEDDNILCEMIERKLSDMGYETFTVQNFSQIEKEVSEIEPDVVLMDINLPYFNGYYWCSEIRKKSSVPVIFISSASDDMNIIMAMDMGGDDFIKKPFSMEVLSAKIRAILRRLYDFKEESSEIKVDSVVLNVSDMSISYKEKSLDLSKNEFKILKLLMENKNSVVSREKIMMKLWEDDLYVEENTLTVNMNRLRKKLANINCENFIHTKVGVGYMVKENK